MMIFVHYVDCYCYEIIILSQGRRVYFDGVWGLVERGSFTDKRSKMGVLNPIIFNW